MMPFRRALISAITLVGGHFLNRRLDRVVLVGALLVVVVVAFIGVPYGLFFIGKSEFNFITWALRLPLILVGALALLSAGLTFRDARHPLGAPLTSTMRLTGAALSLVGVLLVGAVFLVSAMRFTPAPEAETRLDTDVPNAAYRPFHGYIYFGGEPVTDYFDLPAPPTGPERLRGRITLERTGAEGVELYLILNGKYKVEHLISDSRGVFEVRLPAGNWRINSIAVSEWHRRPGDRNLVLFSGHEPTKGAGQYTRNSLFMGDGLEVSLPGTSNVIPVELELRDTLSLTWPPRSDSIGIRAGHGSVPDADFSAAAIAWQPVKGASEYEVQIAQVTHEGTTTRFSPILMRRLPGLTLPLASLPQGSASSAPAAEYSVHVYAFDAEGKLLTENSTDLDDRMFKLAGSTRLGKEQPYSFGRPTPEVISAEYETNDLRLSLAAKLLDQKQFDEARRQLDQVTKDAPRGRASALRGRLAALQGDCVTATRLFDKADVEGGAGCAPNEDRRLCAAPQK
jgi:hypothetical protein